MLMDAGEMDIYSAVREELQRAADAFKDDDDMFADADEDINKVELSRSAPVQYIPASVHSSGMPAYGIFGRGHDGSLYRL